MNSLSLRSGDAVLYAGNAPPPGWLVLQFCLSYLYVFFTYLLSSDALGWVFIDFRGSTLNAFENPPSILVCVCIFVPCHVFIYSSVYLSYEQVVCQKSISETLSHRSLLIAR